MTTKGNTKGCCVMIKESIRQQENVTAISLHVNKAREPDYLKQKGDVGIHNF